VRATTSDGEPSTASGAAGAPATSSTEAALRESEERLRLALGSAGHVYWEVDVPSGDVVAGEPWAILGYTRSEAGATTAAWHALAHPDDVSRLQAALASHYAGATENYRCEYRARAHDGSWRWLLSAGRLRSRDEAGRPLRMAGTLTDVSEVRQLHERLQDADRLAAVGTLAAGVAHEINNPLAYVTSNLGFVQDELAALLREGGAATPDRIASLREAVRDALDGATRVRGIVQGLRQFAHPTRDPTRLAVDVRREIEAAVGLTRHEITHRATLALDVCTELPPVLAAQQELGQVLVNLLVNAAQAIPEGRAAWNEVRVSARAEGGGVVIVVSDTGVGIDPQHVPRVFDPFFTTKPVGSGTGLGLSICHGIVKGLGGTIAVESVPGAGTTFRVTLPAARATEAPRVVLGPPSAGPARVLIVDDEPLVAKSLARLLSGVHEVTALHSPADVLRRAAAGERWDVVLCDLMMPEMSGMELEALLGETAPDVVPRIVYMTGGAFTEQARAFLASGRFYLEKPIEPSVLRAKVAEMARRGGRATG
jgi:PAS domain S-box-containing protein